MQHHEIGQVGQFLRNFGGSKEQATKSLLASSLQIVGLDQVKEKYAQQWEKLEKRVDQAVEAFFTKKLGKKDMFVKMAESRFALLFADTTYEEGLKKANQLAKELLQLLFGELPDQEVVSIETVVLDVNLIEHISEFNSPDELVEYLNFAVSDVEEEKQENGSSKAKEINSVLFRSVVNCQKNLVSMTELLPCRLVDGRKERIENSELAALHGQRERAGIDYSLLHESKAAMRSLGNLGNKPLVFATVDYDTLANSYRRYEYAGIIKQLPAYTLKHLVINITNIPDGILNSRIRQILTTLNPLVLGFVFEVGPDWNEFDTVSDLPVFGISFFGDYEEDLLWIEPLIERAKSHGFRTFWRGVESDDIARRAFEINVDYLSGDVIGRVQETPVSPFSLGRKSRIG
ncbi:hypothetical protein GUA87_13870 [Sneathiella sp. P13V-1]|uniref:hypothetical protein n=1 Tax=Sneathiella sp. P13V-1 TaxID=2697366 RepID=UPI00187B9074|nr:hypothetical protein [Sneathiella sp. P13V-1]MBE7637940.1 hypothetical protein [Sneathiella sp. P13V-1]